MVRAREMLVKKLSRLWLISSIVILGWSRSVQAYDGSAMQICKKTLFQKTNEICNGYRIKRSPLIEALDPFQHLASFVGESQKRKRQVMSIREIIVSSRPPMYDIPYPPVPPSFDREDGLPFGPTGERDSFANPKRFQPLPQTSNSQLGFDSNSDEMGELLNELLQRFPRSSAVPLEQLKKRAYNCCTTDNSSCYKSFAAELGCI